MTTTPSPGAARPTFAGEWALRTSSLSGGRWQVSLHLGDQFPDGAVVGPDASISARPDQRVACRADLDDQRRSQVIVSSWAVSGAPDLWFVDVPSMEKGSHSRTLTAFDTADLADGTVISNSAFFTMPVASEQQVGAVKWRTEDAFIEQIYVAPEHRRRNIARKLVYTAAGFHRHQGWPGFMHVGGLRTEAAEQIVDAIVRLPSRVAPRSERAVIYDPMTGELAP